MLVVNTIAPKKNRDLSCILANLPSCDGQFIRLSLDHRSLIARVKHQEDLEPGYVSLISQQCHTLNSCKGAMVSYRTISHELPLISDVIFMSAGGRNPMGTIPQLHGCYVAPGYRFLVGKTLVEVFRGEGIYIPVGSTSDGSTGLITTSSAINIITPEPVAINIDFNRFGIGGLREQMQRLIRQVLISRIIDSRMRDMYEVKDIKGILLYGPPGTGKTLVARNISKIIPDTVVKKVNGPEVLSMYVGQSEGNIRALFADAKDEYDKKGDSSRLHVVIFDEIDAIGKKRGHISGHHDDKVLTQLLTMIDGLDSLKNILAIGITNRPDILDPALTRAGRLECKIQIPLPTLEGRREILDIYLEPLRNKGLVDTIDSDYWASELDSYSGADIESLIGRAKALALLRNCDVTDDKIVARNMNGADSVPAKIMNDDMITAAAEFQPTYRKSDIVRRHVSRFILFGNLPMTISNAVRAVEDAKPGVPATIGVSGESGTGATALACKIADSLDIPYVHYLSADDFLGLNNSECICRLNEVYHECISTGRAVLILDGLTELGNCQVNTKIHRMCSDCTDVTLIIIVVSSILRCSAHLPSLHHYAETTFLSEEDVASLESNSGRSVVYVPEMSIRDWIL